MSAELNVAAPTASTSVWAPTWRGWSIRLLFEELWRRIPDITLAGEVQRLASNGFAGIKHMPVKFTPQSAAVHALASV